MGRNPIYLIGSLAAVLLVGYTGHIGGKMVHKLVPTKTAVPAASPGASPAASTTPAAIAAPAK